MVHELGFIVAVVLVVVVVIVDQRDATWSSTMVHVVYMLLPSFNVILNVSACYLSSTS